MNIKVGCSILSMLLILFANCANGADWASFEALGIGRDSLIARYSFESLIRGEAFDTSKNNFNGSISNAPTTSGKSGNAIKIATKSNVTIEKVAKFTNQSFTYSGWIKITLFTNNANQYFELYREGSDFSISINNQTQKIKVHNGSNNYIYSSTVLLLNNWYNITVVISKATGSLYLNGVLEGVKELGNHPETATRAEMAQGSFGQGVIDEVSLYDYALPASEVAKLFY